MKQVYHSRAARAAARIFWATTAVAQDRLRRSRRLPSPTRRTRPPTPRSPRPQPVDDAQAKIELLQAQVEALQEALEGVKAAQVKTTPSWKGAPQFEDKEAGWSLQAARPPSV